MPRRPSFSPDFVHSRAAQQLGVFGAFIVLAVGMLWPLPLHMSDHVVGAKYYWDAYTNEMALAARVQNVLGNGPGGAYDSYFFAPIPNSIVFNENLFGLALLYAPFHLLSGEPLFAYNAVLLVSLALSGYFSYLLVARLTGSQLAGVIAGVAFPYCPYAFFEMGRIQLVATQWIPLTFLFLHRAFEERRARDVIGLGVTYALQVGTCLYYAMFLLPLVTVVGVFLFCKHRPLGRRFWLTTALVGAGAAVVIGLMIHPYFSARKNFALTRDETLTGSFDGKLAFFAYVDPLNRELPFLRHVSPEAPGLAHEEVAFPGFVIALLALLALLVPIARSWQRMDRDARRELARAVAVWLIGTSAAAAVATLTTHSLLPGALAIAFALLLWIRRRPDDELMPAAVAVYAWTLLLAAVLFLGLTAFDLHGAPVRGLYHYLYTYVPGWNGIRKISRQAIMTSFGFVVLAGFGAASVLRGLGSRALRSACAAACIALIVFEFRQAPVPLRLVPAASSIESTYRFIAAQPGHAPIAFLPTHLGLRAFRGDPGTALYNYLALYTRRRIVNGKSSFIPPVTRLFTKIMDTMPSEQGFRVLQQLGVQYLVVHAWDMPAHYAHGLVKTLQGEREHYKQVYKHGADYVFELPAGCDRDACRLAETPGLPEGQLELLAGGALSATSNVAGELAAKACDRNPETSWTTGRGWQSAGDFFELRLRKPRELAALELMNPQAVEDTPLGYRVEIVGQDGKLQTVFAQAELRIFREQVFRPKQFVFRVVFPKGTVSDTIRVTVIEPASARGWAIAEASVWVRR